MKIKLLSEGARVPKRADEGAAGYDLYVPNDFEVHPGRNVIPLDIQIELDKGTEGQIRPRSGFSAKGVEGYSIDGETRRFNADVLLGTIDETYRGNVGVLMKSYDKKRFIIKAGTRIAQLVISHYCSGEFDITNSLSDTDRGEGGFGHTGSK